MAVDKDAVRLLEKVKRTPGWRVEHCTKNGQHYKVYPPNGQKIIVASLRLGPAFAKDLRRAGFPF